MEEHFDIAIIDADSIIYQIAHVEKSRELGKKEFDKKIEQIMSQTNSSSGVVYIKGKDNFRFKVDPEYKANRVDKLDEDTKERVNFLYEHARTIAMECDDGEADDYCSITAKLALKEGKSFVVSHIDKDLNSIAGWHHNFRTGTLYWVTDEQAYSWLMQQVLMGDSTDNIKGIDKIGPVKAAKLMNGLSPEVMLSTVINTWKEKQGNEWEKNFIKCANNIYLREEMIDLQPLKLNQLLQKLKWKTPDTGLVYMTDQTKPLDSSTSSLGQLEDNILEESN